MSLFIYLYITGVKKKNYHNFIKVVIFVIYYNGWNKVGNGYLCHKKVGNEYLCHKKVDSGYLCHLTFTFSSLLLKTFYFFEMMSNIVVSLNIFHLFIYIITNFFFSIF